MFRSFGRFLLSALFALACVAPNCWSASATNDSATVSAGSRAEIPVKANDSGTDINVITVTQPANGKVTQIGEKIYYQPNAGFTGSDSFTYTIRENYKKLIVPRSPIKNFGYTQVQGSGFGSAMATTDNNTFYLLTDRGPNADSTSGAFKVFPVPTFNPQIGVFTRGSNGFMTQTGTITLKRPNGTTGITGLPNTNVTFQAETALEASFNGVQTPTAFTPDTGGTAGKDTFGLDTEGLAIDGGGNFWVSDEYGPFLTKFSPTGVEIERVGPYALNTSNHKIPAVFQRRPRNRGMEGLCITPSGKLVGLMQNGLATTNVSGDEAKGTPTVRILRYDPATGISEEFVYVMDIQPGNFNGVEFGDGRRLSEIACVDEDHFVILERDDVVPENSVYDKLILIDLTGATNITDNTDNLNGKSFTNSVTTVTGKFEQFFKGKDAIQAATILGQIGVTPVSSSILFDMATLGTSYNHDKLEGLVILAKTGSTPTKFALVNDDDFSLTATAADIANFGFSNKKNGQGFNDFNEYIEVGDLTSPVTATATVNITVNAQTPQVVSVADGVIVKPIFTVGNSVNEKVDGITPYRMVGIPDGLGAFNNSDNTFTLTMHQELGNTAGVNRAHLNKGAFVSRWTIDRTTLQVKSIVDHNPGPLSVFTTTNGNGTVAGTVNYGRFCSADLPAVTAFFNSATGKGTTNRIFMGGEETGDEGRAFAHISSGPSAGLSYELPHLGKFSWENSVANPFAQDKTLVFGTDDSTPGQVYLYVGDKRATGNDIEKAGLVGGKLFGIRANSKSTEDRSAAVGGAKNTPVPFTLVDLGDVSGKSGAQLQAASVAGGVTEFNRPEDGSWDPNNPKDFYFVTTDRFDQIKNVTTGTTIGRSRLWRLRFTNLAQPELGGTITMLIDGSENPGPNMMDNITVDKLGRVIITEDIGGNAFSGKIWSYSISSGQLTVVAKHNTALFGDVTESAVTLPTAPFNNDEESSGIIDASEILGTGWYLFDVQAHAANADVELVERGQLIAMFIPSSTDATSPSNSTPYIVPVANGVKTKSIFTVGESANLKPDGITPYRMVGIPDGLGAFDNNDGTFTLSMNHELGETSGIVRAHGSTGAFVSVWNIEKATLQVNSIKDHNANNMSIFTSTNGNGTIAGTARYGRFCSADMPAVSAFFNPSNGKGTSARIHMNGEEVGDEGRAFAHIITGPAAGNSYELPSLGKFSWENSVACPLAQDTTIVIGTDDTSSPGGQVYVYIGTKGTSGTDIQKAGLVGGTLYGIRANGMALEDRITAVGAAKNVAVPFTMQNLGDVSAKTGALLQTDSTTAGVTQFRRPEDGAWDPNNPQDFYFLTTDQFDTVKNGGTGTTMGRSRLWRLRFSNIQTVTTPTPASAANGGTITLLIDGSEDPGPNMMDNLAIDRNGRIMIQEDPGGNPHCARIWMYTIATGTLTEIAKHDPARFGEILNGVTTPATAPFTNDEESSGIIDAANLLGDGWFLYSVQAHAANPDTELVERGQLGAIFVPTLLPPTLSPIVNQITNEDTATGAIAFTVTAGSFPITTVAATSSNTTLVPSASAVVAGTNANRTITLTPAANQNGVTTITLTATDAGGQTATTTFTLTVTPVADLPVITSLPTATPNPANAGQVVTFVITATGSTGVQWNFGDGTPVGAGTTVTHTYATAGLYTVVAKVTGAEGDSTATLTMVVNDLTTTDADFDGDGLANSIDDDDDNDGYSDKIETAMGGNPLNATVTPGSKPAITDANTVVPQKVKLSIKLTFTTNGDSLQLAAVLPGSSAATDAIIDVGGNVQTFTLTKGKSPKDKSKSLTLAKDKLSLKLNKVTLAPDFADEGLTNGTFDGEIVNIGVSIIANGKLYQAVLSKEYSAKGGKGSVK